MDITTISKMIFINFLVFPIIVYFVLAKKDIFSKFYVSSLLIIFLISFLLNPIFMMRKHWELFLSLLNHSFWFNICVLQVDNSFWEELAKLVGLVGFFLVINKKYFKRDEKSSLKETIGLGYWIGLGYGVGEAMLLSFLMLYPGYARYFGLRTFGLFLTNEFVLERWWAIQFHAIMGGCIGAGFYSYLRYRIKGRLIFCFLAAMLYHIFIDGAVVIAQYYPRAVRYYPTPRLFWMLLALFGYFFLYMVWRISFKGEKTNES